MQNTRLTLAELGHVEPKILLSPRQCRQTTVEKRSHSYLEGLKQNNKAQRVYTTVVEDRISKLNKLEIY